MPENRWARSPGPGGQVQDALAAPDARQGDGLALPEAMDAEGHQVVHQVVAGRDGVEHRLDVTSLLGDRYLAEAEVGTVVVGHR